MKAVELESSQKNFYLTMNLFTDSIRTLPATPFITRSTSANSALTGSDTEVHPPVPLHPAGSPYGHYDGDIRHRDENGHVVLDQFHCAMCYKYACTKCGARTNSMYMNTCYHCGFQSMPAPKPRKLQLQDPCKLQKSELSDFCTSVGYYGGQPQKWLKSKQCLAVLAETRLLANPELTHYEVWKQIIREQCVNRDIQILCREYNELYHMFTRNIKIAIYLGNKAYEPFEKCIGKLQKKWKEKHN